MSTRATRWAYDLFQMVDVPPPERAVLLALAWDHTDAVGCFPSQARLALLSGYRERRVRDILASLERCGLIKRRRVRKGGKHARTEYTLFGTWTPPATGGWGPVENNRHHRHCGAGSDHRPPPAAYRGNTIPKGGTGGNVVPFAEKSAPDSDRPENLNPPRRSRRGFEK